jgi:fatty-acyl-CoA synthase
MTRTDTVLTRAYWPADCTESLLDTTIGDVLRAEAGHAPDALALVAAAPDPAAPRHWSYGQLLEDAERAARALLGRFQPGERVAVCANNIPEWVVLEYAAALAGLTLVTVNPANRADELQHVLRHSGAAGVFIVDEWRANPLAATVAEVRRELPALREVIRFADWTQFCDSGQDLRALPSVGPEQPAQILYTSGTTGRPKGAVLNHRGLTNNARFAAQAVGCAPGDAWVNPMPLFHIAGCAMFALGAAATGGTLVLMPHFDPALQLELIEAYRGVTFGGVPTMLIALLAHPDLPRRDLSSVRHALSGGAPVPAELVRRVEATLGVPFVVTFAQTEAHCSITLSRFDDAPQDRAETVGRPLPRTEVKVADLVTGEPVAPGAIGEVCARGYLVMDGYLDDPDATGAAIDADGWLHTGDLGSMDERGYCRIEGRVKEMIIRGGENIYPREIELVLFSHPQVADVAVVGVPDPVWGEQVAAVVRPAGDPPPTADQLTDFCRARLAGFKAPRRWAFVDDFPMTGSGKVRKNVLRERLAAGELG